MALIKVSSNSDVNSDTIPGYVYNTYYQSGWDTTSRKECMISAYDIQCLIPDYVGKSICFYYEYGWKQRITVYDQNFPKHISVPFWNTFHKIEHKIITIRLNLEFVKEILKILDLQRKMNKLNEQSLNKMNIIYPNMLNSYEW